MAVVPNITHANRTDLHRKIEVGLLLEIHAPLLQTFLDHVGMRCNLERELTCSILRKQCLYMGVPRCGVWQVMIIAHTSYQVSPGIPR